MTTAVTFAAVDCVRAADDWPNRPITMINPFAAGGPNDVPARMFAQRMGEILGQQVIVENVGGAGGMIGAARRKGLT
jgi:tripartite-type tricarboxylate transporter receptor subunit TctC